MKDDPKKKKLDAKRISQQPWEQAYQRRKSRKPKGKGEKAKGEKANDN